MPRFLILLAAVLLASCNFDDKSPGSEKSMKISASLTKEQAMKLAARGNCLSCHSMDDRRGGPGWREIGVRYGSDPKAAPLIASHIKGGGTFGWNIGYMPMRGGSKLSDSDIDALAQYIATLH
ncbi:MAG TPA: cytochrome c [Burkholderiales bacterium]|nr:cytochrome c [Burkholderiales bacterium]